MASPESASKESVSVPVISVAAGAFSVTPTLVFWVGDVVEASPLRCMPKATMVNVAAEDVAPATVTVMLALPGVLIKLAGTVAVSCVLLT